MRKLFNKLFHKISKKNSKRCPNAAWIACRRGLCIAFFTAKQYLCDQRSQERTL